ncbi:TetR/AcrR family transcriptional regulator [Pseudoalteromonas tunicata]|jgi:AcrR family transcriptional regulator|uniref:Putative transcriptional regulator n=1 Tax=Pseudoalteromonas tunicata D2 TaxID=87626 RepID=A4C7D8_9GAMM|nr:TetR/AcrR family transcriptional regulator [Pseudoalteromonas tunicata]ATC95863.1 hypothetical protein PTUN_a3554 [Pseudoalteromonas tunicata]AXT31407.1 TetR/AcrR family transcriptional regulator [Pseudoalteromonas tunicata]EAR29892.1 putative transcriptional regulator [Pseudoalteromonas tunicata D2]MDP4982175.1 TetR/AcrR family transcriptional regulator [Pseudoalteromonas tunicata]MDP5214334.1 TetR/AcrR family transcriptional regulator [Pseudoalteromonas tunicata]
MGTKDKIIQASIMLFNQQGERAISTNHIAAHLGISPGNLYYHFKNKEDILRHIFALYREHLQTHFVPLRADEELLDQLVGYLDSLFELMWKFHFFYDNLGDILSRDEQLKKEYLALQANLLEQVSDVVRGLKVAGIIEIDEGDIPQFAHTIKIMVSFWTPYLKIHKFDSDLVKTDIYKGLVKVLLLFKPYSYGEGLDKISQLQQHYQQLAIQE